MSNSEEKNSLAKFRENLTQEQQSQFDELVNDVQDYWRGLDMRSLRDESDYWRYRDYHQIKDEKDFLEKLTDEERAQLDELRAKENAFVDGLDKDQQDYWRHPDYRMAKDENN